MGTPPKSYAHAFKARPEFHNVQIVLWLYLAALYIRPAEVMPSLVDVPVVDILTVGALIAIAASALYRQRFLDILPTDLCVLAFWAIIALSNIAWGWFGGGWAGFLEFMPVVFCYFLVRFSLQTPAQFRRLVYLLIALNLFQALNGIVQYHTGVGLGGVVTVGLENRIRGTGIFNDPNDLGMTLVMTAPLVLSGLFAASAGAARRFLWFLVLAPLLVAIYYTNSRGTVLGLGVVLVAFGWRRFRNLPAACVGVMAVLALLMFGPSRTAAMDSTESSAQSRVEAWGEGLGMLKSEPLLGVGYSRFLEFHHKVAHNSIVHTFAELGLIGTFFLFGAFVGFYRALRLLAQHASAGDDGGRWAAALSVSAAGAITCGYFLSRQYVVVPYILLAMGVSRAAMTVPDRAAFWANTSLYVFVTGALTVLSVIVVWVSVRMLGAW